MTLTTFQDFIPHLAVLREVKRAVAAWASGQGPRWLLLTGGPGTGKSHLAVAACIHRGILENRGLAGTPGPWSHLGMTAGDLEAAFWSVLQLRDEPRAQQETHLAFLAQLPWLVVDDLRPEGADYIRGRWERFLDRRYDMGLRTLVTSNMGPDSLAEWSGRLGSRFADRVKCRCIVLVDVPDFRKLTEARRRSLHPVV